MRVRVGVSEGGSGWEVEVSEGGSEWRVGVSEGGSGWRVGVSEGGSGWGVEVRVEDEEEMGVCHSLPHLSTLTCTCNSSSKASIFTSFDAFPSFPPPSPPPLPPPPPPPPPPACLCSSAAALFCTTWASALRVTVIIPAAHCRAGLNTCTGHIYTLMLCLA